ncbi:MAG: chorismate-binding protein [Spirochaetaceae bacterium]|jgi:anthranilate synthase component 1|nr:chorismate-binding protein [Spirochaetaceae bacterium]
MKSYLIKTLDGERFTPFGLAKKLGASVILESTSLDKGQARYSVLLVKEAFRLIHMEDTPEIKRSSPKGWEQLERKGRDILDFCVALAQEHEALDKEVDFPVPSGGVGYLSFEFSQFCDAMEFPKERPSLIPMAQFIFGHLFLIYDHYRDEINLVGLNYKDRSCDLDALMKETVERIEDLDFNYLKENRHQHKFKIISSKEREEEYKKAVEIIKKEIVAGNLLQCVPSRRLEVESTMSALEAYRNLRRSNPSPFLFYLDFGEYQLFGASPELQVQSDGTTATVRPIAGTRRRGKDRVEDLAMEKELLADEKEAAEHLMLVDLARNDLGRICQAGSVEVTALRTIERYSKVMHIVSEVKGTLKPGVGADEVIRKTFPAGTVSGAPKIEAVNRIGKIEKINRDFYAGLVGFIDAGGKTESCITIRSSLKIDGKFVFQAGGGIVYDSQPERELEETNEKMRALAGAIGLEV